MTQSKLYSLDEIIRLAEDLAPDFGECRAKGVSTGGSYPRLCGCPLHRIIDHAKAVMA